jgi:anti-sigma regulatory factor (Ser/Thr protein kinase)
MQVCQLHVPVTEISQVGDARRQTQRIAEEAGFSENDCGRASIIASELATNLARYATAGELHVSTVTEEAGKRIDCLSIDRGPGIAELHQCMEDGYSTGGTPGNGLGAVKRLSTEFDAYTSQPAGTVIFARIQTPAARNGHVPAFTWGVVRRPAPYETMCGDSWRLSERDGEMSLMIVDGLGHGPLAAEAADAATEAFDQAPFEPLTTLLNTAHGRMRGTRGGALAVARINARSRQLNYAGVGNIAGRLRSLDDEQDSRGLVSHNGIVGGEMRKVQEFSYDCPDDGLLVMHSDGLQTRWTLDAHPGLARRHPAVIAGVLFRDFVRGKDDVTVAVVRLNLNRNKS